MKKTHLRKFVTIVSVLTFGALLAAYFIGVDTATAQAMAKVSQAALLFDADGTQPAPFEADSREECLSLLAAAGSWKNESIAVKNAHALRECGRDSDEVQIRFQYTQAGAEERSRRTDKPSSR